MDAKKTIGGQSIRFAEEPQQSVTLNAALAAALAQYERRFIADKIIGETKMDMIGPQTLTFVHEDGALEEFDVFVRMIGSKNVSLGDDASIDIIEGEIVFRYEDDEERTIPVSAPNSLALIGSAIMIAEADIIGTCTREKASVYCVEPGDIKRPGDMFR